MIKLKNISKTGEDASILARSNSVNVVYLLPRRYAGFTISSVDKIAAKNICPLERVDIKTGRINHRENFIFFLINGILTGVPRHKLICADAPEEFATNLWVLI